MNYTGPTDNDYLHECTKVAIAVGTTLTKQQAAEFRHLIVKYQACTLSHMSLLNSRTRLIMHLIATHQKRDLIDRLTDQILEIQIPSDMLSGTIDLTVRMADFVSRIGDFKANIEESDPTGSTKLNIYSSATTEAGINLTRAAEEAPTYMNYLSLRGMIASIVSFSSINTNYQTKNQTLRDSSTQSIVNRPAAMLTNTASYLGQLMQMVSDLDLIIDGIDILSDLYLTLSWTNKTFADSFFNSRYDTIKATVTQMVAA